MRPCSEAFHRGPTTQEQKTQTLFSGCHSSKLTTGLMASFTAPDLENRSHRITSLQYSSDGEELLVSYSSDLIYLFNMKVGRTNQRRQCLKCFVEMSSVGVFIFQEDGKKEKQLSKSPPAPESVEKEDPLPEPQVKQNSLIRMNSETSRDPSVLSLWSSVCSRVRAAETLLREAGNRPSNGFACAGTGPTRGRTHAPSASAGKKVSWLQNNTTLSILFTHRQNIEYFLAVFQRAEA